MADTFRTTERLSPLRLTVTDVAQIGDDIGRQMQSSAAPEIEYDVSFADDTHFSRDSSDGFLANLDADGEAIKTVNVTVTSRGGGNQRSTKRVQLMLRSFGSDLYVSSDDVNWGRGAVGAIKKRLERHRPWFARLVSSMPFICGALTPLPALFIVIAAALEQRLSGVLVAVIILSLFLQGVLIWVWHAYLDHRLLAHTVIYRAEQLRTWASVKFFVAVTAVAADVATLIVLLVILLGG